MFVAYLAIFLLGTICASFIGLVAARLSTGEKIVSDRSRCDACGVTLSAVDLVPIMSWVVFSARCRNCGSSISPFSTITEIVLGTLFVLSYLKLGLTPEFALCSIALVLLAGLVLYDLMHGILPPILLYPFVGVAALFSYLTYGVNTEVWVLAFLFSGFLLAINVFSKGKAMGFADAPLTLGLALFVGTQAFAGFLFSFWIGAVIGIIVLAKRPRGSRMNVEVPFAPYLAAGFLLAYFSAWDPLVFTSSLLLRLSGV